MATSPLHFQQAGEDKLVECAIVGVQAARVAASDSGLPLVYAKDGVVYEKQLDGQRVEIERLEAPRKVRAGWKARLR